MDIFAALAAIIINGVAAVIGSASNEKTFKSALKAAYPQLLSIAAGALSTACIASLLYHGS